MSRRRAFSLLEVLVAVAVFGLATAGLLTSIGPAYDALFRLSDAGAVSGDMEAVRAVAESSRDRATLLKGGEMTMPDGRTLRWGAELSPASGEALFVLRLHADRGDGVSSVSEYLCFEPRWLEATDPRPQWLPHAGAAGVPGRPARGGATRGPGERKDTPSRAVGERGGAR